MGLSAIIIIVSLSRVDGRVCPKEHMFKILIRVTTQKAVSGILLRVIRITSLSTLNCKNTNEVKFVANTYFRNGTAYP